MYKQKFLYLIFISLFEFNYGLVSEWGRCDEKERFCASGLECVYFDPEYSQCQKSKSSTSSNSQASPQTVKEWGQCGGTRVCDEGLVCIYFDDWYSQCQKPSETKSVLSALSFKTETQTSLDLAKDWDQCGGNLYTGTKACAPGLTCVYHDQWYSRCEKYSEIITTTTISTSTSSQADLVFVEEWDQCGGNHYTGSKNCASGLACVFYDQWYSRCEKYSASATNNFITVKEWGRCGGDQHTGSTVCATGLVCVFFDQSYSQCQKPSKNKMAENNQPTTIISTLLISLNKNGPCSHGTFCINGTQILDSNQKPFLIRGINNPHADWDNYARSWALKSLTKIAEYKTNTVRVQWRMKIFNNDLSLAHLENIIVTAKNLGMVSMVQLHDVTGSNDPSALLSCAQWYVNNLSLFQKHKQYVMINIANEWSQSGTSGEVWKNAYIAAINLLRNAGWKGVIVVDAPAYAQDPNAIIDYGHEIMNHDKKTNRNGNILFSLHTYVQWKASNGDYQFRNHLTEINDMGLPVVIGEFADQHPEDSTCEWTSIDYLDLMKVCKERGIGYLGWSWAGNGINCNKSLDPINMVQGDQQIEETWTEGVLSDWGKKIFDTPEYGIKATSVKASFF